jgi:two-component system, NtrC family, C4-dicarboxylate transport response regulator DctD
VTATKDDLGDLSRQNRFREDLYYRLNVVPVELPPLRDRREDIPLLFEHFVLQAALRFGRDPPIISSAQLRALLAHNWPGNVRELQNVASRFVLGLSDPTLVMRRSSETSASLSAQMRQFERGLIQHELRKQNGSVAAASQALGLPRTTLYDKIRKHQLASEDLEN